MGLTDEALALAFRSGLPFVGLRDHAHDPDLDRVVPPAAARTARAIPLAAADDHIRLAVADLDTDLSTLDRYLTGRQVELALAPREELDAILGAPSQDEPAEGPTDADLVDAADAERTAADAAEAADHDAPVAAPDVEPSAPDAEPTAADDAEPAAPTDPAPNREERPGVVAEPAGPLDDHPELAGEVPSWLEPPRRGRRVVLALLVVIVVLAVAAAVVVVFVNP